MPRVPDEWFAVDVDARVRLRRHTEVGVLILDVEIQDLGVILTFDVSGSWAEALFQATADHLAEPAILPGLVDDAQRDGLDVHGGDRPADESPVDKPVRSCRMEDRPTD